ncbi:MAG: KUP/HAK/KT family potassium transporter [Bifidobacterium subtile]|jgi:KUP system potassium uptake protein|nr:KUP/HAK/KT family potassium transporter [Bifidobacterium subtile]MCI1241737.1 KUP/HAK/KT family potassium transporter [Bifidobacterium subtile]MCI1258556.1 KUP/HAK/KT family potassium transporter [Bifidobacterium subtile]
MVQSRRDKASERSQSNDQRRKTNKTNKTDKHEQRERQEHHRPTGKIGRKPAPPQTDSTLLKADTFTNAPKVSRRTLTKEEREELAKQEENQRQEEQRLALMADKGPLARWWIRLQHSRDKVSFGMAIVALGVVYGDIGTSPLYTAQTFLTGQGGLGNVDREAVLGMLSLVFWSITLITTVKYVLIAMRIDNNGEGGIFALYSLIRKYGAWLTIPAMLGGAAFLADSVLTPAVSISSAVEGLRTIPAFVPIFKTNPNLSLAITAVIIALLFSVQSRGTESIGKVFGAVVLVWFSFLAIVGIASLGNDWSVFEALNPVHGIRFLFSPHNVAGIALMGTVFLSTTGAEALYSDMGHVGRGNIYFTWPFINIALVLNYFGQGAWMLRNQNNPTYAGVSGLNPFFEMMNTDVRYVAVVLSVTAGIIASQALITGAFTMVSEATGINWMPHLQVRYPARTRGQLYIPVVNAVLCIATLTVLAIFRDSEHISAAYGLALTITMITTTILLAVYMWFHGYRALAVAFSIVFLTIQTLFFVASMAKFMHGGWFTMLLTMVILLIMVTWNDGTKIERSQRRHMRPSDFLPALDKLHGDFRIPYYSDNIVYLTSDTEMKRLDTDIFFSIFADHPKRARAWWAISVETADQPFTREYAVENFKTNYVFRVRIRIGFKVSQSIPAYIHQVMHDLSRTGELPQQKSVYPKIDADPNIGTIRYVLVHKALMPESNISAREALSLRMKYAIRHLVGSPIKWFGLAPYNPQIEVQPLFVTTRRPPRLRRETVKATDAHRASGPSAGAGAAAGTGGKSGKIEIKIADSTAASGVSASLARLAAEKSIAENPAVEKPAENAAASGAGKTDGSGDADRLAEKPAQSAEKTGETAVGQSAEKPASAVPKTRENEAGDAD